jgi:glycosidase
MHDTAFDMTYGWEMFKVMKGIYKGQQTADRIDTILGDDAAMYNPDAYRMRFTSNHDENSWNGTDKETFGDAAEAFAALTFVLPGMPLIYSGQEAGLNKKLRFFDKDTISWDDYKLASFYTTLIRLRTDNKALFSGAAGGELVKIRTADDTKIYAFTREKEGNVVMGIFNLSPTPVEVKLTEIETTGDFEEVFSKDLVTLGEKSILTMKPWEYRIYIKR